MNSQNKLAILCFILTCTASCGIAYAIFTNMPTFAALNGVSFCGWITELRSFLDED